MEKKKFFDYLSNDEYWMGMAFLLTAKFPSKNMAIAIENNCIVATAKEEIIFSSSNYNHNRQLEIEIISNCKNLFNCIIYCTFTPSYSMISNLVSANLRQLIFFKTTNLSEESKDLIGHYRSVTVTPFVGNLNWIRDYIMILDSFGIFV